MKQLFLLLCIMPGIPFISVHAMTSSVVCTDIVMADSDEEEEEEPDCE